MMKLVSLILPVLIPSWRFFKTIEPSPRVYFAVFDSAGQVTQDWQEFQPRPAHLSARQLLLRMVWNPHRNDELFVMSCAERIEQLPTQHSIDEIQSRILSSIRAQSRASAPTAMMFRLVFVSLINGQLTEDILYQSDKFSVPIEAKA